MAYVRPKNGKRANRNLVKGESKVKQADKAEFLAQIAKGCRQAAAARAAGHAYPAFRRIADQDDKFRGDWELAEAFYENGLRGVIEEAATGEGNPNSDWRAALALLERRFPERWAKPEAQLAFQQGPTDAKSIVAALGAAFEMIAAKHAGRKVNLDTGTIERVKDVEWRDTTEAALVPGEKREHIDIEADTDEESTTDSEG